MPGQDRTGPLGMGPLTGRGLGPCGNGIPRGMGFRRGFGRGFAGRMRFPQSWGFQEPITEKQERDILKQELEAIKQEQAEIEKRLKELK